MNRFHRPRTIAVLALAGALAGSACVEAPPTAADPPAGTNGTSLVPITSQQLFATLGNGLAVALETRVLDPEGRAVRSAVVQYDVVSGAGLFSADSTITNDQGYTTVLFLPLSTGMTLVQARTGSEMVTFAIEVASDAPPSRVRAWTSGAKTRDFRASEWTSAEAVNGGAAYTYKLPRPAEGFAALFAEVVFAEDQPQQYSLTTNVRIVPSKAEAAAGR